MGNRCWDEGEPPTQEYGIQIGGAVTGLVSRDNFCHGNRLAPIINAAEQGDFLGDRLGLETSSDTPALTGTGLSASELVLSWPASAPHVVIENSADVAGDWSPLPSRRNLKTGAYEVTIPVVGTNGQAYLRLRRRDGAGGESER